MGGQSPRDSAFGAPTSAGYYKTALELARERAETGDVHAQVLAAESSCRAGWAFGATSRKPRASMKRPRFSAIPRAPVSGSRLMLLDARVGIERDRDRAL